jgi:arylsulfatase A-like enzyme
MMSGRTRREFLRTVGTLAASAGTLSILRGCGDMGRVEGAERKRPNVILIMTDDQGWGDIRSHGNHLRTGTHGVTRGYENMRSEEVTIAEALKQAGYATGCFGKWHNGAHYPYNPNGQGFDEFLGFCCGHWNNYFDTKLEHNGQTVETKGYISDVFTDAAINFIEKNKEHPFFCYIPYNAPHSPLTTNWRAFMGCAKISTTISAEF